MSQKPRFFVSIREPSSDPKPQDLAAQTEHAAKMEARKLQRHLEPQRRINLYEIHNGYDRYLGALIGAAAEWSQP